MRRAMIKGTPMATRTNMTNPLAWIEQELASLEAARLRRRLAAVRMVDAVHVEVDGQRLINFGSNDYLALAADPRLAAAAAKVAGRDGWGSGGSPLVTGRSLALAELETELARFEQTEAALVFASGFATNLGTVTALVGSGDAIFSDRLNHASLIDGCRLSRATVHVFQHGDRDHLASLLRDARGSGRRLIVCDSLFSMDGDLAPLAEFVELAERYDAMLLVDEAHATGVFGAGGRGVVEHLGVHSPALVRVGTLSKALGGAGGFVAGSRSMVDWIANRARSYIFSTAPPPATAAAARQAIRLVIEEPERRKILLQRAEMLRDELVDQGWNVGPSKSQIIPVMIGDPRRALRMAHRLRQRGLLVPAIRPPSVPAGTSRLRVSLSYAHTPAMLAELATELAPLRREA